MSFTPAQLSVVMADLRATLVSVIAAQMPTDVTVLPFHPIRLEPGVLPAVCLDISTIRTRDPDQAASQLGTDDWHVEIPVEVYVAANEDVQDPGAAMAHAELLQCTLLGTIWGNPQLDNWGSNGGLFSGVETTLASMEPFVGSLNAEGTEPVLGHEGVLRAWLLIPEAT